MVGTPPTRGKLESRSDSPVIAPLNRNTAAIRFHPSFPSTPAVLSTPVLSLVVPFVLYQRARGNTLFLILPLLSSYAAWNVRRL